MKKFVKYLDLLTKEHIEVYGEYNDQRLTGLHETKLLLMISVTEYLIERLLEYQLLL